MKLRELCPVACHANQSNFVVPPPGALAREFQFATEGGRRFYAIQPRNYGLEIGAELDFNPSVAIVGLSPARNQIEDFVAEFGRRRTTTRRHGVAASRAWPKTSS